MNENDIENKAIKCYVRGIFSLIGTVGYARPISNQVGGVPVKQLKRGNDNI